MEPSAEIINPGEPPVVHGYASLRLSVIGVVLMIGAEAAWFAWQDQPVPGLLLALAASVLLLRAPRLKALPEFPATITDSATHTGRCPRFHYLWLVSGIGLSLVVAERAMQNSPGKVWWLLLGWAGGALLIFLVCVSLPAICAWIHHVWHSLRVDWREWLFVLLLMIAAFGIRFVALGDFPPYVQEDEGYFAAQAADLRTVDAWEYNPFRYDIRFHPLLYHTLQAVSIKFLGRTVEAARLPSVLIGVLAVPGLYLAARRMFNRRVAVVAALFLVAFPQHIHFSRLALNQPMDPTLAIWTFAFLPRALDRQDKVEYGLAGLTLGLSQYGFSSARLIPLLAAAYIGFHVMFRRVTLRRIGPGLVVMALVSGALVWPQTRFLMATGNSLVPRIDNIGIWRPIRDSWYIAGNQGDQLLGYWVNQIARPFLGFVQLQDTGIFYGKFDPYLGWLAPVPFLLGLIAALRRWKDPNHAFLLVWWLTVVTLGGIAVAHPPEFQRFVVAIPALSILVGIGVIFLGDVLARLSKTPARPIFRRAAYWGMPIVLVSLIAVFNLTMYLYGYRYSDADTPNSLTALWNILADEVLPPLRGYKVWFLSDAPAFLNQANTGILRYLSPNTIRVDYTGSVEELRAILTADPYQQAVIVFVRYPGASEAFNLLDHLPTMTRRAVLTLPKHDSPLAYIYASE